MRLRKLTFIFFRAITVPTCTHLNDWVFRLTFNATPSAFFFFFSLWDSLDEVCIDRSDPLVDWWVRDQSLTLTFLLSFFSPLDSKWLAQLRVLSSCRLLVLCPPACCFLCCFLIFMTCCFFLQHMSNWFMTLISFFLFIFTPTSVKLDNLMHQMYPVWLTRDSDNKSYNMTNLSTDEFSSLADRLFLNGHLRELYLANYHRNSTASTWKKCDDECRLQLVKNIRLPEPSLYDYFIWYHHIEFLAWYELFSSKHTFYCLWPPKLNFLFTLLTLLREKKQAIAIRVVESRYDLMSPMNDAEK